MPRVTINLTASGIQLNNDLLTFDLPPGSTIKDLKTLVASETHLPWTSHSIYLNGQLVPNDTQTLENAGISDGEMLGVVARRAQAPQSQGSRAQSRQTEQSDPEGVRQQLLINPQAQNDLRQRDSELAATLNDPVRWRDMFNARLRQAAQAEQDRQNLVALLNEDPFNVEAQRKIEEIIRQDRVVENLQEAYERNPEVFVRVHMLYVNTEVNGVPVKAFVDSGAQATIMSPDCAERCGIMRLLDVRYAGMARGVGTAKILGRVHSAEIKIGGAVMPCAFTVMEGKDVDLLFGLDMLKRYRAKIDLEKNALCFEGIQVPFLHESDIPKSFEEAEMSEPTVAGPNGTEIGARSGAVRPKGATASGEHSVAVGPSGGAAPPSSAGPSSTQTTTTEPAVAPSSIVSFPQEDIQKLVTMLGCTETDARQALQVSDGNVDAAASFLLG